MASNKRALILNLIRDLIFFIHNCLMKLNNGKEVVKQKGVALDYNNSLLFTFDNFKKLAMQRVTSKI